MYLSSIYLSAVTLWLAVSATKQDYGSHPYKSDHPYEKLEKEHKNDKSHSPTKHDQQTEVPSLGPYGTNPFGSNPTGTNPLGTCPLGSAYGCNPSASGTGSPYQNASSLMHPSVPGKPTLAPTLIPGSQPPVLTAAATETVVVPCPHCPGGVSQVIGSPPGGQYTGGNPPVGESGGLGPGESGGLGGGIPPDMSGGSGSPTGGLGGSGSPYGSPSGLGGGGGGGSGGGGGGDGPGQSGLGGMGGTEMPGMSGGTGEPTNGCPQQGPPPPPVTVTETYSETVTVTMTVPEGGQESGGSGGGGGGGGESGGGGGGYTSAIAPFPVPGNSTMMSGGTTGTGGTMFSMPTQGSGTGVGATGVVPLDTVPTGNDYYKKRRAFGRLR